MKRRFIALLVATSLIITSIASNAPITAYALDNVTASSSQHNIGKQICGFKVIKSEYKQNTQTNQILFEHVKTGAKILVMKNNDLNRGFSIGFNTPAENDKGINHILEHSLLGGSEKYPTNNMIFNVMNSTYTSFINAMTFQNSTLFPVCSQSEDQLLKLTDIYMDAVYHPLIAKNKKVFEREAWRYELEDINSPLTVNGVVYNEMRGNYGNINRAQMGNDKKAIFQDSNQRYDSGGVPDDILDLSYEEFLDTYNKNYTPSNSFMVLYGDVDYENFLKMINDNYLSSYEKKEVSVDRKEQSSFIGLVEKDYDFPVSKDYDTTNKAKIDLVFSMPDLKKIGVEDYAGLTIVSLLLNTDSSDFNKALIDSNIAENYTISMSNQTYQPTISICANNADPSKKKEFYNLLLEQLKKSAQNGVNKELAKSIISSLKFSDVLETENGATTNLVTSSLMNTIFDDPTIDIVSYFRNIENKIDDNYLESLINKYLVENNQVALVTTTPKAGLLEENNAKLQEKLANKKSSMSEEDIKKLIKETKEFKEWNSKETDQKVINSLKAVSSDDIPIEVKDYNISESNEDDVRVLSANADILNIGSVGLVFDESHLSKEELLYLSFYKDMINNSMATQKYSEDEVSNILARKCSGFSTALVPCKGNKDGSEAYPVFKVNYYAMNEDYKDILNLSSDIILNSKLDENSSDYVKRTINYNKQHYLNQFSEPASLALIRSMAYDNLYCRYANYLNGLDYYNFIISLEKDFESNPEKVINKIKEVRLKAFSKKDLTVLFAGNEESRKEFKSQIKNFTNTLQNETHTKASYDLPVPNKREALTTNTEVQYVAVNSNLKTSDVENNGSLNVLSTLLTEKILIPELRLKGGAYGATAMTSDMGYNVYTYRDNNFVNSLNVINSTDEYMKNILPNIDAEVLDNYIISTFAAENSPSGELSGAQMSLNEYLQGITIEDKKKLLREIKSTTVDDLKHSVETLNKLNSNSNYVVVASPDKIEEQKDMFDKIIQLQ